MCGGRVDRPAMRWRIVGGAGTGRLDSFRPVDLPTAAPSIRDMADLATPMAIRVAATLGLAELAGSAGATAERLASDTGTAPPALRCMLDHLVAIGVFDCDESGRYRATALGAQMEGFK